MHDLAEQPLTIIMTEDIVYMPIVLHGNIFQDVPLSKYLALALSINKEIEFFLRKDIALKICVEHINTPVILFVVNFEDVALVREAQLTNLVLRLIKQEEKLYKIESDIIETLTIHEEIPIGFPLIS